MSGALYSESFRLSVLPPQVAYAAVQGLAVLLMLAVLLHLFCWEPQLGIVPRTIQRAVADLLHLMAVVSLLICFIGMGAHITLGVRVEEFSTATGQ